MPISIDPAHRAILPQVGGFKDPGRAKGLRVSTERSKVGN